MAQIVSTGKTISTTEYLNKKRKAERKKRLILLSLLVLFFIILLFVSRLPQFQIKEVRVLGAEVTGEESVRQVIEERLSGRYFWIVPHSNFLLYGKGRMRAELANKFPRFDSIDISLEGLNALTVVVTEREPYALYCHSEEACWFLDVKGYVFDRAPNFSEGVYMVYKIEPAMEEPLGRELIPLAEFEQIGRFVTALMPLGFKPVSINISSPDMLLSLKGGAVIKLSQNLDLNQALSNLNLFLKSPAIAAQTDFVSKVSELDLRTEDKVFYKFKINAGILLE